MKERTFHIMEILEGKDDEYFKEPCEFSDVKKTDTRNRLILRKRAFEEIISTGLPYEEIRGSFHITMPDGNILIYYPQARKWRIKGIGKYYKSVTVEKALHKFREHG